MILDYYYLFLSLGKGKKVAEHLKTGTHGIEIQYL